MQQLAKSDEISHRKSHTENLAQTRSFASCAGATLGLYHFPAVRVDRSPPGLVGVTRV